MYVLCMYYIIIRNLTVCLIKNVTMVMVPLITFNNIVGFILYKETVTFEMKLLLKLLFKFKFKI